MTTKPDYACLKKASEAPKIDYPKPDGKPASTAVLGVPLNTNHEEDQPIHSAGRREHSDREEPAALRRAGPALLPGRRVRSGGQRRRQQALPDQRAEPRALQDLRHHQDPAQNHHLGGAEGTGGLRLPQHVGGNEKAPGEPFFMLRLSVRLRAMGKGTRRGSRRRAIRCRRSRRGTAALDQLVEHVAMHQLPRGCRAPAGVRRVGFHRVPGSISTRSGCPASASTSSSTLVAKRQYPPPPSPCTCRVTATKGASSAADTDLFHPESPEIVVAVAANDAGEQLHHRLASASACPGRTRYRRGRCARRCRLQNCGFHSAARKRQALLFAPGDLPARRWPCRYHS